MTELDDALVLTAVDESVSRGHLDSGWSIGGAINGGLLMVLAGRALGDRLGANGSSDHESPVAFTAYFLSAAGEGPVEARTEVVHVGRTLSTGQVSLFQEVDGAPAERMRALASYGDLSRWAEPVLRAPEPPAMPPPEQCVDSSAARPQLQWAVPFHSRLDMRLDPATVGWAVGQPSGHGRIRAWVRFADHRPVDALSLLLFLDALPPVAFDLGILGWAPTLEFSGHVRAEPTDGWLCVETSTCTVTGGLMEEDAMIWDSTGAMVAQSRQLAGIRLPRGTTGA